MEPNWIKLSENKPNHNELVLTYGHPNDGGSYIRLCDYADGIFRSYDTGKENKHHISHWMRIPNTPIK